MAFPKKKREDNVETEPWNVAQTYVHLKIMKPLYDLDKFETLSIYGTEDIYEQIPEHLKVKRRLEAINRFKDTLKLLLNNADFVVRIKDKKVITKLDKDITDLEILFKGIYKTIKPRHNMAEQISINEVVFNKVLFELQKIKREINVPLNKVGFIFKVEEDYGFKSFEHRLVHGY